MRPEHERESCSGAQFAKGPFTIRITSSTSEGSGRITSQAGLTPVLDCLISNGTPGSTGCSGTYLANQKITLKATPADGFYFSRWPITGCATGACEFAVIQNQAVALSFNPVVSGNRATQGEWEPPITTPLIAVHTHMLVNGKVLMWGSVGGTQHPRSPTSSTPASWRTP